MNIAASNPTVLRVPCWPYAAESLVEVLSERAQRTPERVGFAFVDYAGEKPEDRLLTDATLDLRARRIAVLLQTRCRPGDRVLLVFPAGIDYLCAFFGCLYASVVAVPVYPPLNLRLHARLASVAQDCDARVVLASRALLDQLGDRNGLPPALARMQWLAGDANLDGFEHSWCRPTLNRNTLAMLQYTSGSTGVPKGVMVTQGNLLSNLYVIALHLGYTPEDHHFTWLPPFHDMGLIGATLGSFSAGVPLTFMTPAAFLRRPQRWLREISARRATVSGAPNFAYELCLNKITDDELESLDLSHWKIAFSGAEPVLAATLWRFAARFASCGFDYRAFYPCYGMAETTLFVSGAERATPARIVDIDLDSYAREQRALCAITGMPSRTLVSCGGVAHGHALEVVDPVTLCPRAEGEVGEILVAGPSNAAGYWQRVDETEHTFGARIPGRKERFLRTGDLGFVLGGELFVSGRLKDVIIVRGVNHYPHDIESTVDHCHDAIRPNSGIAFSIVVEDVEQLVFVQEVGRREKEHADKIFAAIQSAIMECHDIQPYAIALIESGAIPKTTSGKLARRLCRDDYCHGRLTLVGHWVNPLQRTP